MEVADFITARYRFRLEKQNKRTDIFNAVIEVGCFSIVDFDLRYKAIAEYLTKEKTESLSEPLIRCKNIIKGKDFSQVDEKLLREEAEIELYNQLVQRRKKINKDISNRKYSDAILRLADFKNLIDEFFDRVLVMDKNDAIRANRINLVKSCVDLYYLFADFSKIL